MARKAAAGAPKAGLDRNRIGERLEASVAGLQELRLLRERHEETVRRVLREAGGGGGRQAPTLGSGELGGIPLQGAFEPREARPANSTPAREVGPLSDTPSCEELRGELWRNDGRERAGGRGAVVSPRLELGSDTQLAERAHDNDDSDSRPSSGFYDVSDGASSSLSTSCPSVYSEGPGDSLWSVHCNCQLPRLSAGHSRPRSTDDGRPTELSTRAPREGAGRRGKVSQRPVSAGELTLLRCYRGDTRTPSSCPSSSCPEPRFRCDLVSRNGGETYRYPSPLHAVALQSPLFTSSSSPRPKEEAPSGVPRAPSPARPKACPQARRERLDRYICGLVLRLRCGLPQAHCPGRAWKGRPGVPDRPGPREEGRTPSPSEGSRWPVPPERQGEDEDEEEESGTPLYRGRHLNHQLVRCPEAGERAGQGDLLKRLSGGRKSAASRCRSETNLALTSLHRPGVEPEPGAASARRRQRWASVLEIPAPGWPRKAGLLGQAQAFLSRHQRPPSSDSPPPLLRGAETLPRLAPVSEGRFRRSKSFRELRRKVQLSFRPWSLKAK